MCEVWGNWRTIGKMRKHEKTLILKNLFFLMKPWFLIKNLQFLKFSVLLVEHTSIVWACANQYPTFHHIHITSNSCIISRSYQGIFMYFLDLPGSSWFLHTSIPSFLTSFPLFPRPCSAHAQAAQAQHGRRRAKARALGGGGNVWCSP